MSSLGPISYGKKQEEIFLGREIAQHRDYSESTAVLIDNEVRKIVDTQMERVMNLLTENRQDLVTLSEALIEHEVLEYDEIQKALHGEMLSETKKSRSFMKRRQAPPPAGPVLPSDKVGDADSATTAGKGTDGGAVEGETSKPDEKSIEVGSDDGLQGGKGASIDRTA
jgi:cell division protease FtsH